MGKRKYNKKLPQRNTVEAFYLDYFIHMLLIYEKNRENSSGCRKTRSETCQSRSMSSSGCVLPIYTSRLVLSINAEVTPCLAIQNADAYMAICIERVSE